MGTAPPSKPLSEPARPFKRKQHRACLQNTFLPKPRKNPTVLMHLISRREWQKVLIRVTLFPSEVTQRQKMTWYGVQWSLLPLHLACALQPPSEVISMLLSFHSDTARVRMNRCSPPPQKKRQWRRAKNKKKKLIASEQNNYALYQSNQGQQQQMVLKIDTALSSSDSEEHKQDTGDNFPSPLNTTLETEEARHHTSSDSGSLLDDKAFAMDADRSSRLHVFETYDESTDSEAEESAVAMPPEMLPDYEEAPAPGYAVDDPDNKKAESLKKPFNSYLNKRNIALQLSANGSLEPMEVDAPAVSTIPSKMQWNLDPLLMEADALLPLHIACLYRASPTVITYLLDAYPKAVAETALGMLPIHMVAAGFDLPAPVLAPPPGPVPFPMDDEYDMPESLQRLEKACPESLEYPSQINGMTPKNYIDETLDDGSYKDACLEALGVKQDDLIEDEEALVETRVLDYGDNSTLTTRVPDEVHCQDDTSTLPSLQTETSSRYLGQDCLPQINGFSGSLLYTKMLSREWERALAIIEECPKECRQWQYGIELDRIESMNTAMWKRLPIHSACVLHAPIGLIEALVWAYPRGIEIKDPFTGALPLHLACRHSAPPELVKTVIIAYPTGSRIHDAGGRLPLHMACLSGASRLTFIYLLKAYPHAVLVKDEKRRTPLQYAKHNHTLKPETIELLELVHHFLERQPALEDDYSFEGFQTLRAGSHCSDSCSVASGFYENSSVVSPKRISNSDSDLNCSPLSGSQASEEKETAERLVREFSQILEGKNEAEDVVAVTKLAPRFRAPHSELDGDLPLKTSMSNTEIPAEELSKISEEDSAFDDTTETEEAVSGEHPPSSSASYLEKPRSTGEGNISEEEAESSEGEAPAVERLSKLGALMTKNEDDLTPTGSLACLYGVEQATRPIRARFQSSEVAEADTTEAIPEDSFGEIDDEATPGSLDAISSASKLSKESSSTSDGEETGDAATSAAECSPASADNASEDVEQEAPPSNYYEVVEGSQHEAPLSIGASIADENATLKATSPPIETAKVDKATGDEATFPERLRIDRSVPDSGLSAAALPVRDVDPADEAAGCLSPVNVPASESSNESMASKDTVLVGTNKTGDRPARDAQVTVDEQDRSADEESVPYEPLIEDADAIKAVETIKDAPDSTAISPLKEVQLASRECSTSDVTIVTGNTSANIPKDATDFTSALGALSCPNHDTLTDADKPPSDDSTEFQFDYKSDLSQTGDSITDIDSTTSITSEPQEEPVIIQERDDQNKLSSPRREERLDIP